MTIHVGLSKMKGASHETVKFVSRLEIGKPYKMADQKVVEESFLENS